MADVQSGGSARSLDRPGSEGVLGTPHVHLREVDSTNVRARALAASGAPHGTLVTADVQTAGRGRQGRAWAAPAGSSLLCSLVIRDPPQLLSLLAGVAVAQTCVQALTAAGDARSVALKWPNDVWVGGRKVAGILVEGRPQERWAVLGIGLNVAVAADDLPAELRARAATLGLPPRDVDRVLAVLLDGLCFWLQQPGEAVLGAVRELDALRGSTVSWTGGEGVAAGIDGAGRLLVDAAAGRVALDAGEVHLTHGTGPRYREAGDAGG